MGVKALRALARSADGTGTSCAPEMAVVDGLRALPAGIFSYLEALQRTAITARSWRETLIAWSPHHALNSVARNLDALRNMTSWLLALLWVVSSRNYSAGCVIGASFLFSPTMGS